MAIFLALLTAAIFGAGDFFGGLASKKIRVIQVVAGSHLIGAVSALIAALLLADQFAMSALALGALAGSFGVVGVALLYRRLAEGPMSVVAPLTALTSAVVPTSWGVIGGERLSTLGWLGVIVALAAVGLVSMASSDDSTAGAVSQPVTVQVVVESLLAGAGFGGLFIVLDATDPDTAPWPIVGARVFTSLLLFSILLLVAKRDSAPVLAADRNGWLLIMAVGVLDTGANMSFLYASNIGELATVSVLAALYPISTVILARVVLGERMTKLQGAGFVLAMIGTELLVIG